MEKSLDNVDKLKKIDLKQKKSYENVMKLIEEMIIPFDKVTQPKGSLLYRCRKNMNGETFNLKEQLSYIQDYRKIKKFGRVNEKYQSVFYGANEVFTALCETSSLSKERNRYKGKELFTVGEWKVVEDFEIAALISNEVAIRNNKIVKEIYNKSLIISNVDRRILEIRKYFSDEFAKKCDGDPNLYKISCAYFNHLLKFGFGGALYPSVKTEAQRLNIALNIAAVDIYLVLNQVINYELDFKTSTFQPISVIDIRAWENKNYNYSFKAVAC